MRWNQRLRSECDMAAGREQLAAQRAGQAHQWGHILPDRWQAVAAHAGERVLDVGCANGVYVAKLLEGGAAAYGVDLLPYAEWAHLPGRCQLADATRLPYAAETFDTILSFETLEHVLHPQRALAEYRRVTRKNIILSVPNCETPPGLRDGGFAYHHWVDRTHVNFFTFDTLVATVEAAGFRVLVAQAINPILPAVPLLTSFGVPLRPARGAARLLRRISPRKYHMSLLIVAEKIV